MSNHYDWSGRHQRAGKRYDSVTRERPDATYCGDWCGKCPNYPARCPGCIPCIHPDCYFVKCCIQKGIEHCGLCENLPCEKLSTFVPDDRKGCYAGYHIDELRSRCQLGTDRWLLLQEAKWKHLK